MEQICKHGFPKLSKPSRRFRLTGSQPVSTPNNPPLWSSSILTCGRVAAFGSGLGLREGLSRPAAPLSDLVALHEV